MPEIRDDRRRDLRREQARTSSEPTQTPAEPSADPWRKKYAYHLGVFADIFGYPWTFLPWVRWSWVTQPIDPKMTPYAALNQWWHCRQLTTAEYRDGGSPNNDALYSAAWVDMRKEPIILSHAEVPNNRYFCFQCAHMSSDNFAYIGTRATGNGVGNFAIRQASQENIKLPRDVQVIESCPTAFALILARTYVEGEADYPNVHAIQDSFKLTPLSLWGQKEPYVVEDRDVWEPYHVTDPADPLGKWKTMNRAMTENPPIAQHDLIMKTLADIGIGVDQDINALDEDTKAGLAQALPDGEALLDLMVAQGGKGKKVNGWTYPPLTFGRAGLYDDFVTRGSFQCRGGMIAHEPIENVYINTTTDKDGKVLDSNNKYTLHFAPDNYPETKAFWSVTMYDMTYNLVANDANIYSVGSTKKLFKDPDGGLTIHLQREDPGADKQWLPTPPEGEFFLILRDYYPGEALVDQSWVPPGIEPA